MDDVRRPAISHRFLRLAEQFRDKEFRDTYVASHTRRFLARQMRKFRGNLSQTEFAESLEKRQTIVSRLENPNYSGWTLGTLLEIASKLDLAVVVRFVDFPRFLKYTDDLSESAMRPAPYDQRQLDEFARGEVEEAAPLTDDDLIEALNVLRKKEPAKEAARQAQQKSVDEGLFPLERPERGPSGFPPGQPQLGAGVPF